MLQYCRLAHKACELTPSAVISQWLLSLCGGLQSMKLIGDRQRVDKFLAIASDYYVKYRKEHHSYDESKPSPTIV